MVKRRRTSTPSADHRIVGIGASAGGIAALRSVLQSLSADPNLSVVVIQHLPTDRPSQLVELLSKWSPLPVVQAADGEQPRRNHIYVGSPGDILTLETGVFRTRPAEGGQRRPGIDTIDAFLESLARDRGSEAVAVILSGTGSDGAAGAICVKQAGGLVLVQDPLTAMYDNMPQAVIAHGAADYILPIEEIGTQLVLCASPGFTRPQNPVSWTGELAKALDQIVGLIRKQAGFDLGGYKTTPLLWRIQERMNIRRVQSFEGYESLLRDDPAELEAIIRGIPIHVTQFFRDPDAWEVLARDAIEPLLRDQSAGDHVRVWTPACATGEEAYSVAMLLSEAAEAVDRRIDFRVFASDASAEILARASHGAFAPQAMNGVSPVRKSKFFYAVDGSWRVKRSLRERMVFAPQDLLLDPPFANLDLITCRNVLIYLEPEAVKRIVFLLHSSLRVGGYLFLGHGEPLSPKQQGFEAVSNRWHIYRKSGPASEITIKFPFRLESADHSAAVRASAYRAMVQHFDTPSVLVDDEFRILRVYGNTERILRLPAGQPTDNLLDLAQPDIVKSLKVAAKDALADRHAVTVCGLRDPEGAGFSLSVRLTPIQTTEDGAAARLLVSFIRAEQNTPSKNGRSVPATRENSDLAAYRDWTEAIRMSNQELEASREELQALNEELRASNEQLNVANDDLNRANAQLREKVGELEMQSHVLSSGVVMTLFLDKNLQVRWFTPAVSDLFPLTRVDVGRRITDLVPKFDDDTFVDHVRAVMSDGENREREVQTIDGRWFVRAIRPYRAEPEVMGVAVTFTEITANKRVESDVRESRARLSRDLDDSREVQRVSGLLLQYGNDEELYEAILDAAISIMRADFGSLQLLDAELGRLELMAYRNFHPKSAEFWRCVSVETGTTCGAALRRGTRVIVPDVRVAEDLKNTESLRHYLLSGILAVQSTPLTTRDGILIGLLSTHWRSVHAPDESDLRLFDVLARQAADFCERRDTVELLQARNDELERFNSVSVGSELRIIELKKEISELRRLGGMADGYQIDSESQHDGHETR